MQNRKWWFTSDWHVGELQEENTHSFLRPYPTPIMVERWIDHLKENMSIGDTLVFVGDLAIQLRDLMFLSRLSDYNVIIILGDKATGE